VALSSKKCLDWGRFVTLEAKTKNITKFSVFLLITCNVSHCIIYVVVIYMYVNWLKKKIAFINLDA
jgi:hypothetical protein